MPPKQDQGPPSWSDALSQASQVIAAGLAAPDADLKFGLAIIGALSSHLKKPGSAGAGAPPGGPLGAGGAGSPGAGGPGGPPPGAPPGTGSPAGAPAGGGAPNQAMSPQGAPGGPAGGSPTQGLTPNPDEMRRVLADVAGQ